MIPPHATAKGTVLRGSRISSPMIEANSRPTKAKQTTPKADSKLRSKGMRMSCSVRFTPKRRVMVMPRPIRISEATAVPMPPMLLTHLPDAQADNVQGGEQH